MHWATPWCWTCGRRRFRPAHRDGYRLLDEVRFTVIRGNISEVKTLASGAGTTKGVDADVADRVTEENLDGAVAFASFCRKDRCRCGHYRCH